MRKQLWMFCFSIASVGYWPALIAQQPTATQSEAKVTTIQPQPQAQPQTQTDAQNTIQLPPEIKQVVESGELAAWMIEAARVAQDYVTLLDQGNYAESWSQGAALFQRTISQKEWIIALRLARKRLGNVRSRTLKDERPAWDPKGLPKGAYMVVEYNTSFDHALNSGELLTLMREPSGQWKVLTYQVN